MATAEDVSVWEPSARRRSTENTSQQSDSGDIGGHRIINRCLQIEELRGVRCERVIERFLARLSG